MVFIVVLNAEWKLFFEFFLFISVLLSVFSAMFFSLNGQSLAFDSTFFPYLKKRTIS
jgi:hypothetical protein